MLWLGNNTTTTTTTTTHTTSLQSVSQSVSQYLWCLIVICLYCTKLNDDNFWSLVGCTWHTQHGGRSARQREAESRGGVRTVEQCRDEENHCSNVLLSLTARVSCVIDNVCWFVWYGTIRYTTLVVNSDSDSDADSDSVFGAMLSYPVVHALPILTQLRIRWIVYHHVEHFSVCNFSLLL